MLIKNSKKVVIKLGSTTVVDDKGKFKKKWVTSLIKDIKKFRGRNDLVIVSSGAIALGQNYLKIKKKRIKLEMSQAIAAVGQIHLAGEFQKLFDKHKIKTGQILISPDDTEQRRRALNVRRTFDNLFKLKAIPIVNENDTTATAEIKYGDNDRLAARVAQIIGADTLIILSDVDGLYDKTKSKTVIKTVSKIDSNISALIDNKKKWASVNPYDLSSNKAKDVYIIGDATDRASVGSVPKSGYIAYSMGKVCAYALHYALMEKEPPVPSMINTCYSLVNDNEGISVSAVYKHDKDKNKIVKVVGASGVSPNRSEIIAYNAWDWAQAIWQDM